MKRVLLLTCLSLFLALSDTALSNTVTFLVQDSQPKYFLGDTKEQGLCGDIYHALQARLSQQGIESTRLDYYLPIKRILMMVEQNPAHVFCGSGRNEAREKRFIFAKTPVYHVSNVVAAHQSDLFNPKTLAEISEQGATVGALYGTSSARYLKAQLPEQQVNDSFNDLQTPLKLMAEFPDRLRYFYYHDLGLNYLVKSTGLPLRVVPTKFRTVPQWLIYSRNTDPMTAQAIEKALRELEETGELAAIVQRYIY